MAVHVKSCYLFLLDNINQSFVPTEKPLDETEDGAYYFLEKNIEKCMKDPTGRPATFKEGSEVREWFLGYRNRSFPFLKFAQTVAIKRYDFKYRYEIFTISDLFMCEVEISGVDYVVGLELTCKEERIHHVVQEDGGIRNNLTTHPSIIPQASLKSANFFMIHFDKLDLTVLERLVSTEDDDTYVYADKILECETKTSIKEAIKTARMVMEEVIEQHKLDK
jgi:37-kD nucleoid-associated bacterial protein